VQILFQARGLMDPLEKGFVRQELLTVDPHIFELKILIELRTAEGVFEMQDNRFIPGDKRHELTTTK
jgi:hypothetical protein